MARVDVWRLPWSRVERWYLGAPPKDECGGNNSLRDRVFMAISVTWQTGRSRSCDRVPSENRAHDDLIASLDIMDARERLEVEDEDARQSRLGTTPSVHF